MKVLLLNGSPKAAGNTFTALHEVEKTLREEGVETELLHVGHLPIRSCIACGKCAKICPQGIDIPAVMQELTERMKAIPQWADICAQREAAQNRE